MALCLAIAGLLLALTGHVAFWVALDNRLHNQSWPRKLIKLESVFFKAIVVFVPPLALWEYLTYEPPLAYGYRVGCMAAGAIAIVVWSYRRFVRADPPQLRRRGHELHDIAARHRGVSLVKAGRNRLLAALPGNQLLQIMVEHLELAVANLPPGVDELRIVHLSDLHFTGRIAPQFFHDAIGLVNEMQPQLIVITGDIVDKAICFDWIDPILAPLVAPLGKFFVLGNHDMLPRDEHRLRGLLVAAGLYDLGTSAARVPHGGGHYLLCGNEQPWFPLPSDYLPVPSRVPNECRILASHAPDEFYWAAENDFDLVLCGHTHGGQIRLPVIGPLYCPSHFGLRFAGGTFATGGTLMHVSRGLSGVAPLRFNCPPEITEIVLKRAQV